MDLALSAIARGGADQKLRLMCTMIISIAAERFGTSQQEGNLLRWEEIAGTRVQAWKGGGKGRLGRALQCGEEKAHQSQMGKGAGRELRASFIVNPFGVTRKILEQKQSGHLTCSQEKAAAYLSSTYSDAAKETDLNPCSTLITPPLQEPISEFTIKGPP